MQIHNAIITGSFSYNGADLSNVTSSNAYSASLSSRTTDLESTSSVLVGASSSFSSILTSVSSSQQQISSSFLTLTASFNAVSASQQQISASYIALSASYNTFSGSASTRVTQIEQVYATTGSNSFRATQSITGSLTVTGQIIAQTINVQQVTSSIIYSSGSNNFGNQLANTQTFTGSVNITGSSHAIFGNVGIGTNAPTRLLDVSNTSGDSTIVITSADATGQSSLFYGKPSDANIGGVLYNHCNNQMSFRVNDTTKMSITSTGNVGIGTCTPNHTLHISAFDGCFALTGTRGTGTTHSWYTSGTNNQNLIFNNPSGDSYFYSNSTPVLSITTNGFVGIGLNGPTQLLHIQKDQACTTTLLIQNTSDLSGAAAELRFFGNEGIAPLKNNQQISFVRGSGGVDWALGQPANSNDFVIAGGTNQGDGKPSLETAERMRITSAGITCFSGAVCVPNLRVQSGFADLVLCGSNTTSPHIGGTFSITTNQDGNGRTIIGNAAVGRAMYLEAGGNVTFNCAVSLGSTLNIPNWSFGGRYCVVGTSFAVIGPSQTYSGLHFVSFTHSNAGNTGYALMMSAWYPGQLTIVSQYDPTGLGVCFRMNGNNMEMKTSSGTVNATILNITI